MSLQDVLNDSDVETLRKLLKLSGRAALERRRALCIEIGIDSGEISAIGWLSENDFAVELIDLLVNRELEGAVFKLCETLKRDFDGGINSSKLAAIAAKLKQLNSQPDLSNELGEPPSPKSEDYAQTSISKNKFLRVNIVNAKKQWLTGGAIILIGLSGFKMYERFSKEPDNVPQTKQPNVAASPTIDYSQLEKLLADKKWKEADQATTAIMLKITNREKEGFLTNSNEIAYFACQDLDTIDRLWMKYSNGRFGFSIQNAIWVMNPDAHDFFVRVGWLMEDKLAIYLSKWISYDSLTFSLNAPLGHLPTHLPTDTGAVYYDPNTKTDRSRPDDRSTGRAIGSLLSRFAESCKQSNRPRSQSATVSPTQQTNVTTIPNVDYSRLEKLLADKKWKEANQETLTTILKVLGRKQQEWITDEKGQYFSCSALQKIDQLWVKYSDGRFGYSMQKRIFSQQDSQEVFAQYVGWMDENSGRTRSTFIFRKDAPEGHLPTLIGNSTEVWLQRLFVCRDL